MFTSPWPAVGQDLDQQFAHRYFFHQNYKGDFHKLLFPPRTYRNKAGDLVDIYNQFFGTKCLSIFIAQKPYGWIKQSNGKYKFEWNNPESEFSTQLAQAVEDWNVVRVRFPYYRCVVYGDMYTANEVARRNPGSEMPQMMGQTIEKLKTFCVETPQLEYAGTIESQLEANFFSEFVTEFFKPGVI